MRLEIRIYNEAKKTASIETLENQMILLFNTDLGIKIKLSALELLSMKVGDTIELQKNSKIELKSLNTAVITVKGVEHEHNSFHSLRQHIRKLLKRFEVEQQEVNAMLIEHELLQYRKEFGDWSGFDRYFRERFPNKSKESYGDVKHLFGHYGPLFDDEFFTKFKILQLDKGIISDKKVEGVSVEDTEFSKKMTNLCKCYLCALGEIQNNDFVLESLAKAAAVAEERKKAKKPYVKRNTFSKESFEQQEKEVSTEVATEVADVTVVESKVEETAE